MILCFSGTGNSLYAADVLADAIGDEVVSLNDIIKNDRRMLFNSKKPFVVVSPIYAWRLPKLIEDVISRAGFNGNSEMYFVCTMGSDSGNCDKYCQKLCEKKGMKYRGFCGVVMPSNYLLSYIETDEAKNKQKIVEAIPVLMQLADSIRKGEMIEKRDKAAFASVKSGMVNSLFNKHMVSAKDFVISDDCTGCGNCASVCPVNNVKMIEGRPLFGSRCMNCFACINRCPAKAIDIKGKTEKRGRYVCPEYTK